MTPKSVSFFVPGVPVAKGSARAFFNKATGRGHVIQDNAGRQKPWASLISTIAIDAGVIAAPVDTAVFVEMDFTFPRPKAHFRGGKNIRLREDAPTLHTKTPDVDKVVRLVFDALSSIAWVDDRQAQIAGAVKRYGDTPGVMVRIFTVEHEPIQGGA